MGSKKAINRLASVLVLGLIGAPVAITVVLGLLVVDAVFGVGAFARVVAITVVLVAAGVAAIAVPAILLSVALEVGIRQAPRSTLRKTPSILGMASSILPASITSEFFGDTHEVLEEMAETASRWQIHVYACKAIGWAVLFTLSPEALADVLRRLFNRW